MNLCRGLYGTLPTIAEDVELLEHWRSHVPKTLFVFAVFAIYPIHYEHLIPDAPELMYASLIAESIGKQNFH